MFIDYIIGWLIQNNTFCSTLILLVTCKWYFKTHSFSKFEWTAQTFLEIWFQTVWSCVSYLISLPSLYHHLFERISLRNWTNIFICSFIQHTFKYQLCTRFSSKSQEWCKREKQAKVTAFMFFTYNMFHNTISINKAFLYPSKRVVYSKNK